MTDTANSLSARLVQIVEDGQCQLFAGAGCSAAVNIPVWGAYLESLALFAGKYEPALADLIRNRIAAGLFLEAATLFRRHLKAAPSDMCEALSAPFRPGRYDPQPLVPLMSLPFRAVTTTNYDSSILEAWTTMLDQRGQPHPQLLEREQVTGADFLPERYVLFLHGRGNLPIYVDRMVLDEDDYKALYALPKFTQGLFQCLSTRTHLFLGFSFADPGIDALLRTWRTLRGPTAFPRKHYAILPASAAGLRAELLSMNVVVLTYSDSGGSHAALWEAIRLAAQLLSQKGGAAPPPSAYPAQLPLQAVRDVLAFSHARASIAKDIQPLRNVVLDGMTLAELTAEGAVESPERLAGVVAQKLGAPIAEVGVEIERSILRLLDSGRCTVTGGVIAPAGSVPDQLTKETRFLATALARRLSIRNGVDISGPSLEHLREVIEDLLMARAWDLAADFVQPRTGSFHRINDAISYVLTKSSLLGRSDLTTIESGLIEFLTHPEKKEAEILADLGRVAFAVQLALGNARTTLAYSLTLPQKIYLDASVLLPAIVDGHPLHGVYQPVLSRLQQQASSIGCDVGVVASVEFLNEIVSHRTNSVREVKDRGLEDPDKLEREVQIYGAENLNVFVSAYATHVGRSKRRLRYGDFLEHYAPYTNEGALRNYLNHQGLRVEQIEVSPEPSEFWTWYNALTSAYEKPEAQSSRKLQFRTLVKHEAWQLFRLAEDQRSGIIAMFVTQDGKLRRAVSEIAAGELSDSVISGTTMVNLIDLLLGVKVDHSSLARLLWGVHALDPTGLLRRYFTDKGLAARDEIKTLVLPEVVDQVMQKIVAEANYENLHTDSADPADRARVDTFLDRYEQDFYYNLEEAAKNRVAAYVAESRRFSSTTDQYEKKASLRAARKRRHRKKH